MMKYQTLHAHTFTSDGKMGYLEMLDTCRDNEVGVVAFTDHDSLPDKKSLEVLHKNTNHKTKWIVGIELSSGLPSEVGEKATSSLHVVGLFVDPFNEALLAHCKKAKEARGERMKRIVGNLSSVGIKISEDDCVRFSKGETVGRPHIVSAINSHPENIQIIKKYAKDMRRESLNNLNIRKKYQEMKSQSIERYPYYLFLQEDAFLSSVYVDYLYYKNFDDSVKLIRDAGGVAFLAHWFTCKDKIPQTLLDKLLQDNRLDGLETVCGLWTGGRLPEGEINSLYDVLKSLVEKNNKLESGGSDTHSKGDIELLKKESWYAQRTIGLAEIIIERSGVDTKWSSF